MDESVRLVVVVSFIALVVTMLAWGSFSAPPPAALAQAQATSTRPPLPTDTPTPAETQAPPPASQPTDPAPSPTPTDVAVQLLPASGKEARSLYLLGCALLFLGSAMLVARRLSPVRVRED